MVEEKDMIVTLVGFELGKSGTGKNGPWQIYKYKFSAGGRDVYMSSFNKYDDVNAGDTVKVVYKETPNPNGQYPYKNILSMAKSTEQTSLNATSKQPTGDAMAKLKAFATKYREAMHKQGKQDLMSENHFIGTYYRTLNKDKFKPHVDVYNEIVMAKDEEAVMLDELDNL